MKTCLRPLGARVVIERLALPDQTRGGLYLLGREYPTMGRVLAIGTVRWHETGHCYDDALRCMLHDEGACHCYECPHYEPFSSDLALGDLVVFDKFACELRAVPRESDHFVLDAKDILLRIRERDPREICDECGRLHELGVLHYVGTN